VPFKGADDKIKNPKSTKSKSRQIQAKNKKKMKCYIFTTINHGIYGTSLCVQIINFVVNKLKHFVFTGD